MQAIYARPAPTLTTPSPAFYNLADCWSCGSSTNKVIKCAGCKFINYCNHGCRRKDERDHQRSQCKSFSLIKPSLKTLSQNLTNLSFYISAAKLREPNLQTLLEIHKKFQEIQDLIKSMNSLSIPTISFNTQSYNLPESNLKEINLPESPETLINFFENLARHQLNAASAEEAQKNILNTASEILKIFNQYNHEVNNKLKNMSTGRLKKLDMQKQKELAIIELKKMRNQDVRNLLPSGLFAGNLMLMKSTTDMESNTD